MKFQRTLPPAAAPISLSDLLHGFRGIVTRNAVGQLERDIKDYFGVEYSFLVSSGKAALFLILTALNSMNRKRKVIIPAYTCYSVPSAIRMAGLEIVLCDIQPETLDFDYSHLKTLLDRDTLCVVPTHLFGIPSDVEKVRGLCGDGIFIVEDAAQAMGAWNKERRLGTLGDVSFFSLGRGKNVTCGNGGIILTSSKDIAESIRRQHSKLKAVPAAEYLENILEVVFLILFLRPNLFWFPKGLPFLGLGETKFYRKFPVNKFTAFQAGLLINWRLKMERFNRRRSAVADYYLGALQLKDRMPAYRNGFPYNRFPVFLGEKSIKDALCGPGSVLGIRSMYPAPIHAIPELAESFGNLNFEGAEKISNTLVTLPTHILLKEKDTKVIGNMVKGALREAGDGESMLGRSAACH